MARHLTRTDAIAALRRGRAVEQLLGFGAADGRRTVRWLTIAPRRGGSYVLREHHVFDEGGEDAADVGAFTPVDEDELAGEGVERAVERSPEEALARASAELGAAPARWVNGGLVADEYLDHRRRGT